MSQSNVWSNPSSGGAEAVAQMAAFLEERSNTPDMVTANVAVCQILDPKPGNCILEVGCGSGVLSRLIAPHLKPGGWMVGLDISAGFLLEAHHYARCQGLGDQIAFECGTGESLPYPDAVFDSAFAARLLLHADKPESILLELRRVVRPGGRVVVMDWDFDTVVVDHSNRDLTRRVLHWRSDHHGGDNWSGRKIWRRMKTAGFERMTAHSIVPVAHDETYGLTQSLWRAAQVARDHDAITAEEHDLWVGELKNRISQGTYFASIVYFIIEGFVF